MVRRVKKKTTKTTARKSTASKRKKPTTKKRVSKKSSSKRKPAKKRTSKRTPAKKSASRRREPISNQEAQWVAYKNLQQRIDVAWNKLQADVKRNAPESTLIAHKNHLLLLLGECNYMARECMKFNEETASKEFATPLLTDQNNPFKNRI